MAGPMEQLVMLAPREVVDDLDMLRIVLRCSRASAGRLAMTEGPIEKLKKDNAERIARLAKVAAKRKMTVRQFVVAYAGEYSNRTYGPSLEDLERGEGIPSLV